MNYAPKVLTFYWLSVFEGDQLKKKLLQLSLELPI